MMMTSYADENTRVAEWVASQDLFSEWHACREVFRDKFAGDSPSVIALPILSCQAVGGSVADAVPVAAAWSMLRYAADLFDAVQDGDPLPKRVNDRSAAIEYANGLIFSAFKALAIHHDEHVIYRLVDLFSDLAFRASRGQNLSQQYRGKDSAALEMYWQATLLKSGSIFHAGLGGGAIVGRATPETYTALRKFGNALGVIRQIIDDCRDMFDDSTPARFEITLPLLLLSEKLREPISLLAKRLDTQAPLSKMLNEHGVPEMVASVLMEWHRRAEENLLVLGQSAEVQALEAILQDFVSNPWLK